MDATRIECPLVAPALVLTSSAVRHQAEILTTVLTLREPQTVMLLDLAVVHKLSGAF